MTEAISKAFALAQGEFVSVPKNKEVRKKGVSKSGKEFEYSYFYADLDSIIAMVRPILVKHGLSFNQTILLDNKLCETVIYHDSGQQIRSYCPIILDGKTMQDLGGSITYAKRYGLSLALGISTDDDIDENEKTGEEFSISNRQKQFKNHAPAATTTTAEVHLPPTGNVRTYSGPSEAQLKRLYAIANSSGWPRGMADAWVKRSYEKKPSELTRSEYDATCDALKATKFNDILKEELKPFMPIDIKAQFEAEKKKQSSYIDHTKTPLTPPTFNDDEIPY